MFSSFDNRRSRAYSRRRFWREEQMDSIEILYNTALLQVAEKIQCGTFYRTRVSIGKNTSQGAKRTNIFLTPRTRATYKILSTLARALSEDITPHTITQRINSAKIGKVLKLPKTEVRVFQIGGAEALCEYHRMMFVYALQELGVTRRVACDIASCIIMRRCELLSFFNAVDDIGIEETILASGP